MTIKILTLLIFYFLIFYSIVGYGYLFSTIVNQKNNYKIKGTFEDYGINGIFGLVALTVISYSTILFLPHNFVFTKKWSSYI